MIIELMKYIFGYIEFKAYGGLADRFLNLCTREKIPLWNIKNINGNIFARTTVSGYLSLKNPARKSGMKLLALNKRGLKFFLIRNKSRLGIAIGVVAVASPAVPVAKAVITAAITTVTTSISMTPITGDTASSDFF